MMRLPFVLLIAIFASCNSSKPETLVEGGYDEMEMAEAIARARGETDTFIAALESSRGSDFAVKVPIEQDGETEHFWITDLSYRDGHFEGKIGNDPGIVTNVSFGQTVRVRKEEISDWLFFRDGKMHGNYTIRPLFATMSDEDATRYRSLLAEP